jgi:hypothetical protein
MAPSKLQPRLVAPLSDGRLVVACGGESGSALLLVDPNGALVASLAEGGGAEGEVDFPTGLAVEEGDPLPGTRVAVLDQDGGRVQVFTLDGRCCGSFVEAREFDVRLSGIKPNNSSRRGSRSLDPPEDSD